MGIPIDPKKIDYDADNVAGPEQPFDLRCPNGHPARRNVTKPQGQGRVECTVCNWNDQQTAVGTDPPPGEHVDTRINDLRQRPRGTQVLGGSPGAKVYRGE